MRLQKEELAAVAGHILEQIKEKNKVEVSKKDKALIAAFFKLKTKTYEQIDVLNKSITNARGELNKTLGTNLPIYGESQESYEKQLSKSKEKSIPTLDEIKKQVILKSLFSGEKELKEFIKELVAKY